MNLRCLTLARPLVNKWDDIIAFRENTASNSLTTSTHSVHYVHIGELLNCISAIGHLVYLMNSSHSRGVEIWHLPRHVVVSLRTGSSCSWRVVIFVRVDRMICPYLLLLFLLLCSTAHAWQWSCYHLRLLGAINCWVKIDRDDWLHWVWPLALSLRCIVLHHRHLVDCDVLHCDVLVVYWLLILLVRVQLVVCGLSINICALNIWYRLIMSAWNLWLSESNLVLLIVHALLCAIGSLEGRGYLHIAETTEVVLHIFGKLWLRIAKFHATRNTTFFLTAHREGFDHYWALSWVQYV